VPQPIITTHTHSAPCVVQELNETKANTQTKKETPTLVPPPLPIPQTQPLLIPKLQNPQTETNKILPTLQSIIVHEVVSLPPHKSSSLLLQSMPRPIFAECHTQERRDTTNLRRVAPRLRCQPLHMFSSGSMKIQQISILFGVKRREKAEPFWVVQTVRRRRLVFLFVV